MKILILLILSLIPTNAFTQRKVSGIVLDEYNELLVGAGIREEGTNNYTESDVNGKFEITTLKDTCVLTVFIIGLQEQLLKITEDTNAVIRLDYYGYTSRWLTFGANYDFVNSKFGVQISNGYDEKPLIHFEDFSDRFLYKASFQTDLDKDYGFGGNLGWKYPTKYINLLSIGYNQARYSGKNRFDYRTVNVSASSYFKLIHSDVILNTGFQYLNKKNNLGIGLGLQRVLLRNKIYSCISAGYYFDYWTYAAYIQGFAYKNRIGLRVSYDRIGKFDFLTFGINFTFNRTK